VAVVGCSGSGKTTLARALAGALDCPHVELDEHYHQPGWTELGDAEFRRRIDQATEATAWVVDGNYSVVQGIVWERADTVVWFDLPFVTVMARTIRRTLRRTITREELWNGNREPWTNLWSINPQRSIIAWTATRHRAYRQRYAAAESDPQWSGVTFVRLRSSASVEQFLQLATNQSHQEGVT
jgi:adenylate kinase family enzyme